MADDVSDEWTAADDAGDALDVLTLLDEVRSIAQNGLEYAENPYDRQRYDRLLDLVSDGYGDLFDLPPETVRERFAADVGHATAKIGGGAAIFDDAGRILLVERADDGTWGLPSGYVDPGESPAETAVRETREETGLDVEVTELVDVYYRPPGHLGPHSLVSVRYLCERHGGETRTSHETTGVRHWHLDDVPVWHKDHEQAAHDAYERWSECQET